MLSKISVRSSIQCVKLVSEYRTGSVVGNRNRVSININIKWKKSSKK